MPSAVVAARISLISSHQHYIERDSDTDMPLSQSSNKSTVLSELTPSTQSIVNSDFPPCLGCLSAGGGRRRSCNKNKNKQVVSSSTLEEVLHRYNFGVHKGMTLECIRR
jgi:hypothetical protein